MFTELEAQCVDNCVRKIFASTKVLRAYLPLRLKEGKITEREIERRLNNPTDSYGVYFDRKAVP